MYEAKSPILFLIFNRPDTTIQVFNKIRQHKPKKLYIAADGPRGNREGEQELCRQTRDLIKIDWDCEVKTLYREKNLGCRFAVSGGIKWFFENEPEGIILEDDCLPDEDFFRFCDTLLDKYRDDTRIVHISGTNLNKEKKFGESTYYFSKSTNIWGWASWRRVWCNYDANLTLLEDFLNQDLFTNIYSNPRLKNFLIEALTKTRENKIDTWDYQYAFLNFWNNGLCICTNYNLVTNIGFDQQGTHTSNTNHKFANQPFEKINEITHPQFFIPILDADYRLFELEKPLLVQRLKDKIRAKFKAIV